MMASAYCLAFLFHISVLVERSKFLVWIFEAGNSRSQPDSVLSMAWYYGNKAAWLSKATQSTIVFAFLKVYR